MNSGSTAAWYLACIYAVLSQSPLFGRSQCPAIHQVFSHKEANQNKEHNWNELSRHSKTPQITTISPYPSAVNIQAQQCTQSILRLFISHRCTTLSNASKRSRSFKRPHTNAAMHRLLTKPHYAAGGTHASCGCAK